jgi:hypothetical protein
MATIKCFKAQCEVCKVNGLIQVFLNNKSEVRYSRVRHYQGMEAGKPKFSYCQQSKGYAEIKLKEYLSSKDATKVSTEPIKTGNSDQLGHSKTSTIELETSKMGSKLEFGGWSSSLVRTLALRAKGRRSESGSAHH